MRRRKKLSKRNNRRNFKRTARKVHSKNLKRTHFRGGIRL